MSDLQNLVLREVAQTREVLFQLPWEDKAFYAMWLVQTFHIVNHSTRLVALAGAYTPMDQNELHARFVDHSKEERGHQLVCVSDLKAMGLTIDDFPCLYHSAAMYQVQYYWIQHRGAAAFFGYTLALECLAREVGDSLYRLVVSAHGASCTKFVKLHASDDVEHSEKALLQVAKLPARDLESVRENLSISSGLYRGMLVGVSDYVHRNRRQHPQPQPDNIQTAA
jgi:hypothetical protein